VRQTKHVQPDVGRRKRPDKARESRSSSVPRGSEPDNPTISKEVNHLATNVNSTASDTDDRLAQAHTERVHQAEAVLKEDEQRKQEEETRNKRLDEARRIVENHRELLAKSDPQIAGSDREIKWHAGYAAAAAALLPPGMDLAGVMGVQLKMLSDIAKKFNQRFSDDIGKAIIGTLVGSIGTGGLVGPVSSIVKAVPVLGIAAGGLSLATVAYGTTYALGKIFTAHFASGGHLLDFDPVIAKEAFRRSFDQASTPARP
jgi:uncharacterized protein (DUF697 family)